MQEDHALTRVVHKSEVVLRRGISLVGGEPEPLHGFLIILHYAPAVSVHVSEDGLRQGVSLVGGQPYSL